MNAVESAHQFAWANRDFDEWAYRCGVKLNSTRPGKPTENWRLESLKGQLRDEFLIDHEFVTMDYSREGLNAWKDGCNTLLPHGS
ncbi:MAG: integrase core domain-containing protein [Pseudomonadota bacterium]|nr:integrase core domain-containing protein [Pseudomonadota bacterium]